MLICNSKMHSKYALYELLNIDDVSLIQFMH